MASSIGPTSVVYLPSSTSSAPPNDASFSGHPPRAAFPQYAPPPPQPQYHSPKQYTSPSLVDYQAKLAIQSTKTNHLAAQKNKKRKNASNDTLAIKPTSVCQETKMKPDGVDQSIGVAKFPYKSFTIGIPEDVSMYSDTLVAHQKSAIDAGAVYEVGTLTQVSFCGVFKRKSLILFNIPRIKRQDLSQELIVLSLIEYDDFVIGGIALASYSTCYNIEIGTRVLKLPADTFLKEVARCFVAQQPRSFPLRASTPKSTRSFPTELHLGGLSVIMGPIFPLPSNTELPMDSMTIWSLVEWLTYDPVAGKVELLKDISAWAARIYRIFDNDMERRRVFLLSVIGKQVDLKSGTLRKLGGIHGKLFVVEDGEGNREVVQMDEILGEHVNLESVQPQALV